MIQPHVVREIASPQGTYRPKPVVLGRPVTPEAAHTLTQMLAESLEGETRKATVAGYQLAGKTGTAQIPGERATTQVDDRFFYRMGPCRSVFHRPGAAR
jgi:cell division protein FtsI/penicillin-binding protein 2